MRKFSLIFIILIITFFLWMTQIEPKLLLVKNVDLSIPNWSHKLNNTTIAVISDLHIGSKNVNLKKLQEIVKKTNSQQPDLIFILGDYDTYLISKSRIQPKEISNALSGLQAKYGVISILGNHDISHLEIVKSILAKTKIQLLEDEKVTIKINNENLNIIGTRDLWYYPNQSTALKLVKNSKSPIILLSHNPDLYDKVPQNVSLILSGHTHGGEVRFPFIGAPFVPSEFDQRFIKGHVVENNKHIYITSGIGSLTRFRFGNIPEIAVLHLNSQETTKNIINDTPTHKNYGNGKIKRTLIKILPKIAKIVHYPN